MKIKKNLLLGLTSLFLLGSCTQKKNDDKIVITWWNNYQVPADGNTSSQYNLYYYAQNIIEKFQKDHPNVEIKTEYFDSYSAISTRINAVYKDGGAPSIALSYPDYAKEYLNKGYQLNDMSKFFNDDKIGFGKTASSTATFTSEDETTNYVDDAKTNYDDFIANYMNTEKDMYDNGAYYSLPYSKSGEVLFVNESVFNKEGSGKAGYDASSEFTKNGYKAPVSNDSKAKYTLSENYTLDDLITLARQIQKDYPDIYPLDEEGNPTYVKTDSGRRMFEAVPLFYDSAENMFITILNSLSIPYVDDSGKDAASKILFNNDQAKQVVRTIKKLSNEGLIATRNQLRTKSGTTTEYGTTYFEEGKTMMVICSTPNSQFFVGDGYTAATYKYPHVTKNLFSIENTSTEKYSVISQGPSMIFFKNKDERVDRATFEFYKQLTQAENSVKLYQATNYFPIRTSAYEDETIKEAIKASTSSVTESSSKDDKNKKLNGNLFKYNADYADNNYYFMTKATHYTSLVRSAVKELVNKVLNDVGAKTDDEIKDLVESAFLTAYKRVLNEADID